MEVLTKQGIIALLPCVEEVQENFGQLQYKKMETKLTHILAHTSKAAFIIILALFLLLNSTSKDI